MSRFLIAGTGSGCGKTTVTCAILSALRRRGEDVRAFKCGPDYLDPMLHSRITGVPSYHLDSFFCGSHVCDIMAMYSGKINVIEGVMGFYDGGMYSSWQVSALTDTPVILVIDSHGMKESLGAVMQGFLRYQPNVIAGFLFNRLPSSLFTFAQELCRELETEYFGCLPPGAPGLESRHLGLITEGEGLNETLEQLGMLAEQYIQLDKMLSLPVSALPVRKVNTDVKKTLKIAVARDEAFCFLYEENLRILEQLGCELVWFSPLKDECVPEADGMLLCGGYPELYARQLSENGSMRESILQSMTNGMPCIAECGGFLYLHKTIETQEGRHFPMVGYIDADAVRGERLKRFGYVTMTATTDNLLCRKGESIRAHEFHYWDSTDAGNAFIAKKTNGSTWTCVHADKRTYAGFPHLYFPSDVRMAERFAEMCRKYQEER